MKGYKVFNPDWKCRDFQYEVGKTYEMEGQPICCKTGFHFCEKASYCFKYYDFDPKNHVAEVKALGDIATKKYKSCTNKIKIVREISWDELLNIVNEGECCTGFSNTGDYNTGDYNTGYRNTGNYNTGYRNTGSYNTGNYNTGIYNTGNYNTGIYNTGNYNTGDYNTGYRNTGYRNTGYRNTGDYNTGDWNTGDFNTGDWNTTSFSSGVFNTEEAKILMFNKPSDWSYRDWLSSDARYLLNHMPKNVVEWVPSSTMTDEEKAEYPTHETTGGYLKILDETECAQMWWNCLDEDDRNVIFSIPNFDKEIFEEITGIEIEEEK